MRLSFHWWRTVFWLIPTIAVYTIVLGIAVDRVEPLRSPRLLRALVRAHVVVADPRDHRRRGRRSTGLERLEPGRTYVFVANHQSIYDIPILFWSLPFQLRIIAKESLGSFPLLGPAPAAHRPHAGRSQQARIARGIFGWASAPDGERACR